MCLFSAISLNLFNRYLVNCERNKSLQNICIDEIVHLSMEKCFIGSMVHLVFPLTSSCNTTTPASKGSPVALQSVVHLPTVTSKTSGPRDNCTSIPELLASYIIRIKSENRMRMVIGIFIECIDCFKEKSCLSTEKCLNSIEFETDDRVHECSIESASSEISIVQACFNANESESLWNNTGINLVLSMMSNDDESRDGVILSSNPSLDERVANDLAEDVADSENRCCDNCYVEEESVLLETSSNFMKKADLNSLQQSFLCASNSNISQICTSITVNHTDKFKYSSASVASSAVGNTPTLLQSEYSDPKKCSSLPAQTDYTRDSSSLPESSQREANCINRTFLDNKLAMYVNLETLVSSPEYFDSASSSASDISFCKTPFLSHSNVPPQVCNSNSVVKFESMFDSPSSEELDVFLAQFDFSSPRATSLSEEISTPELFSPLENKQTSRQCLSSTPLSSESTLYLRRTKHGNSLSKSDHSQSKKRSKTLWKYMKGMEKELTSCSVTPLTHGVITSDENQGKLDTSPLLFFENSPESFPA